MIYKLHIWISSEVDLNPNPNPKSIQTRESGKYGLLRQKKVAVQPLLQILHVKDCMNEGKLGDGDLSKDT